MAPRRARIPSGTRTPRGGFQAPAVTATSEAAADIVKQLGMRAPRMVRTSLVRPNLSFEVERTVTFPMEAARKVHFPVMLFFVLFILTHVFLVFFTGALKNLNHMYTSRGDATDAWGLVVFLVSVAVTAAAWFLLRPSFTAPAASKFGTVGR